MKQESEKAQNSLERAAQEVQHAYRAASPASENRRTIYRSNLVVEALPATFDRGAMRPLTVREDARMVWPGQQPCRARCRGVEILSSCRGEGDE